MGNADDFFPLGAAFVGTEFDFVGAGGAELGFKFIVGDFRVVHADVFLPDTEEVNPVIESGKTRCRHERSPLKRGNFAAPKKNKPSPPHRSLSIYLYLYFLE